MSSEEKEYVGKTQVLIYNIYSSHGYIQKYFLKK